LSTITLVADASTNLRVFLSSVTRMSVTSVPAEPALVTSELAP